MKKIEKNLQNTPVEILKVAKINSSAFWFNFSAFFNDFCCIEERVIVLI